MNSASKKIRTKSNPNTLTSGNMLGQLQITRVYLAFHVIASSLEDITCLEYS